MTVGFHAPFPPARTGVADYAAALFEALRERADVRANPRRPCEVDLYHVGNNQLHGGIYRQAMERPGVAVLHDAVLHHLFLGQADEAAYVEEFVYNYGEWGRDLARELWRDHARSAQDERYFRYPMLRRIAEVSRAVVVHNPGAAAMVRAHAPAARVAEVPHLFVQPAPALGHEVERLRASLGVRPSGTLFGVFGYLRESKRLSAVLRAFERVRSGDGKSALLIAGSFASSHLERALWPLLTAAGVSRRGYLTEREFWLHAAATDACINLRYPAAGETSGIAVRMMGIGKATIVTAGEETSRFPEDVCVRVDPGSAEVEELTGQMLWLARFPEARREIGRRAAEFIAREHAIEVCAGLYRHVLAEVLQTEALATKASSSSIRARDP